VPAGRPVPETDNALFVGAGPGFFEVMRTRLVAGREFTDRDGTGRPAVAIVNDAYAQRHFPGQNPLGQHLAATVRGERRDLEIVGVVGNTHAMSLRAAPRPTVYVAYAQLPSNLPSTLVVRVAGPLAPASEAIQHAVQKRMPSAPVQVRPFSAQVGVQMVQEQMLAVLASGFGALALGLVAIGLYGLLGYRVARRTREIGVRMALGAERRQVMRLVLGSAAWLVLVGLALGVPAALAVSQWVESLLFGLKPADRTVVGGALVVLLVTAQLAASLPAWRASRVDPLAALRHE
jgi:predicted permease